MAAFVVLPKWTDKTYAAIKHAPAIAEEIKKFISERGVEIKGWHLLMGQYDEMCIPEAPDAETVGKTLIPLNENTALIPKPCRLWAKLKLLPSLSA